MSQATKELKAYQERLQALNSKQQALKDEIDLCKHDFQIPDRRIKVAKVTLDHAIAIVNGKPALKNTLSPKDIQRLVQCVKDLSNGKRKFLMLALNDDKSGVIDLNTELQYFFEE